MSTGAKAYCFLALLLVSVASSRSIPWLEPWGADFHNLQVYNLCAESGNPYLISGPDCGDLFGRPFVYPPLLLHCFAWTKPLTLRSAMWVWSLVTATMLGVTLLLWTRLNMRARPVGTPHVLAAVLLAFQFPSVFMWERGGTDAVPTLLWTLAVVALSQRRLLACGALAGVATAFKLYPVFAAFPLGLALLLAPHTFGLQFRRIDALRYGGAFLLAFVLGTLTFGDEARVYFSLALPKFAAVFTPEAMFMHSLGSLLGPTLVWPTRIFLLLWLALWCVAVVVAPANRKWEALAGALAISTYFANTSWDYNLVTTYPLLLCAFLRAVDTNRWTVLVIGTIAVLGDRALLLLASPLAAVHVHIAMQLGWLVLVAVDLMGAGALVLPFRRRNEDTAALSSAPMANTTNIAGTADTRGRG